MPSSPMSSLQSLLRGKGYMGDQYPPKTIRDGGPTPDTIMHGVSDGDGACNIPQDITSVEKHDGNYADVCAWFKFDMFELDGGET